MSRLLPVAVYGLEVPPGDVMVPASIDFPATIRITMAAVDPTQEPEADDEGNIPSVPRSTLRIIKQRPGGDDEDLDSEEEDDDEYLQALLGDDDEDDEDEDEPNGGPSDPAKSKKARQEAALKKLLEAADVEEDEDMEGDDAKPNGVKSKKGKQIAVAEDEEEDSDDDSDDMGMDMEQFVICTLDTERNYNQTLDITIGEGEKAFFVVSGTHAVHLTGNYIIDEAEEDSDDEDDGDYDLPPDMDELVGGDDASSDELDDVDMIERVQEIDTDEEEAPKLVKKGKGKNKRAAEDDETETLDDMIAKQVKTEEPKLSKKQLKKLKNNKGEPVAVEEPKSAIKENSTPKSDKKVQFAKNLEQGPTGSAEKPKQAAKGALGVKTVQGVTVDDRKLGSGKAAKSGDKVSMRYIGKLDSNGKVFDSNKKGSPFSFKLGRGEVIKGWDIGVAGMTVGGERRLTIPAHLAYGSSKTPGIPPNSTLVFDVKLLEIK